MTEIRWDPAQKASMYRASLCGLPPATIADGVGVPEALVAEHLRRTPPAERLGYLLQQEADRVRRETNLVRRELSRGRPRRLTEIDLASASVADMYATARACGTSTLTQAADTYARAVDRLRRALTGAQALAQAKATQDAEIRSIEEGIEARNTENIQARERLAMLRRGKA